MQPVTGLSFSLSSFWANWVFDSDVCGWPSSRRDGWICIKLRGTFLNDFDGLCTDIQSFRKGTCYLILRTGGVLYKELKITSSVLLSFVVLRSEKTFIL